MRLRAFYQPRMQLRIWKLAHSYIPFKDSRRPAWIGLWARIGWRYFSVGLSFQKPA